MGNYIELENGLKFMILSSHMLDGEKYLFLASVSEDIKYIFAKLVDDKIIEPVEDGEIIARLTVEAGEKAKKMIESTK